MDAAWCENWEGNSWFNDDLEKIVIPYVWTNLEVSTANAISPGF